MTATEHDVPGAPADAVPAGAGDPPRARGGDDPLVGLLVDGRYRILRRLARGGMASVYVAQDERLDRPVALKVMHPHLAESAGYVARFRREARAAARIVHPGVVSVFDQGVVHGQGFLVMELVDGPNLRALLNAQGAFTVGQALRYTQEVLDALRAAHRVGVIHRDVKPENVLVPSDGPVRVTDFGLARAASEVSLSTTGTLLGTVPYMAPEVASGTSDARTDIYSVGIMLDEMLTGHVPWEGETAIQMALSHVREDVPLPSTEQPWIPSEVDDLVACLAARDPDERPVDAREAMDLVARVRASLPRAITTRRADVTPHSSGARTTAMEAIGQTSPLPTPLTTTSQIVVHTSGSTPPPGSPRPNRRVASVVAILLLLLASTAVGGWWWWSQYGPGSYLQMPATTGRAEAAVVSDLRALGLASRVSQEFSDTVRSGTVVGSEPAGGEPVHKDDEVVLVVSKGVDMRVVPDLAGRTQAQATQALDDAGLALGSVGTDWSETVAQGQVISQSSRAGTKVRHDSTVDVVVSRGREPITVPDLSGRTQEEAGAALTDLGLVPEAGSAHSDSVPEGRVISQETPAGQTLHRGDTVSFVVSQGPELVAVPDVVGRQEKEATKALEKAGFKVSTERVLGGFFGTVRATDPAAGTKAPKGSTVTITIV